MGVLDHWNRRTVEYIKPHLSAAHSDVRIATGYFTVQGYDLLRESLSGKRVYILVGYDEASRERLRQAMIDNLEAHLRHWDADNRRLAVLSMVEQLQNKALNVKERVSEALDFTDSRIRNQDHSKLYIIDERLALVGSSNLSVSGLRLNHEGMAAVDDPERVHYWMDQFENYWTDPDTIDLTEALLAVLLRWLKLEIPFDIYLKTIEALVSSEELEKPRPGYRMPLTYQWVVIKRILRQLEDWRGAMLVASTGLGKTVMATHTALMMREQRNQIRNVIVIAPKGVRANWIQALNSAGLNYQFFVRELLDQPEKRKKGKAHQVQDMLASLEQVDDQYLLIIDESQHFSNRVTTKNKKRRSFQRLERVVREKQPFVLLLTATPYTKDVSDINNQLALLPPTAPPADFSIADHGQMQMNSIQHDGETTRWWVDDTEDFFEQFVEEVPVTTIISTSTVARDFATSTDHGDYVEFPDGNQGWIPRIELRKIKTPVPLESEISAALEAGVFRHKVQSFQIRGRWHRSKDTVERLLRTAWASSPLALQDVVLNTMSDSYDVDFETALDVRQQWLEPIFHRLRDWDYRDDVKFMELVEHVRHFHAQGKKVIIFTERLATAVYLEEGLQQMIPGLWVANTVARTEAGTFESKSIDEVTELVIDFAPTANEDKRRELRGPDNPGYSYSVLISTDAYGVGVNLQDASVVISYDLAWTAAPIIQRAGRILRFWREPRTVMLYVFVPGLSRPGEAHRSVIKVEDRLRKLQHRTEVAEQFSELPMIPQGETAQYASLSGLAGVAVEDIGLVDSGQLQEFNAISPFLRHYQAYYEHIGRARNLGEDLTSALEYSRKVPHIYVLMRHEGAYHWAMLNLSTGQLENFKEDELLRIIDCEPDTLPAPVDPDLIEQEAQRCKRRWCKEMGIDNVGAVERICALYLMPQQQDGDEGFLSQITGI